MHPGVRCCVYVPGDLLGYHPGTARRWLGRYTTTGTDDIDAYAVGGHQRAAGGFATGSPRCWSR